MVRSDVVLDRNHVNKLIGTGGAVYRELSVKTACNIFILDPCEQVQIADCKNCRIVVGPCAGSVFILDCTNCRVTVAAKQLRLREVEAP